MGALSPTPRARAGASAVLLGVLVLVQFAPVVACLDECMIDYVAVRGGKLGKMELPDARLNTWILGWVQHSLLTDPSGILDANIFYPTPSALTQSEHLLAPALSVLPLRLFTQNAVAIHQSAILLSSFLLALGTAALVRWSTGRESAALLAGAVAIFMPWRLSELSHIQLLSAQWFPWVWLGMSRIACDGVTRARVGGLALVLTAQVLSSFYLAYYLLLSCGVLLLALWIGSKPDRRRLTALALAAIPPGLALGVAGWPYLRWSREGGFRALATLFDSVRFTDALSITLPVWTLGWRATLPRAVTYEVPLVVFVLALLGLLAAWRRGRPAERSLAGGLAATCVAAFVLLLGRELELGNTRVPLPASWLAAWIPGFENLRNPLRWGIVIGLAAPVLAGFGIAAIEAALADRKRAARIGARIALVAALMSSVPLPQIPARNAWAEPTQRHQAYRALAALPFAPVIEIPWPIQAQRDIDLASRYMLASTLHWRPISNGMSGYAPPAYDLLRQIAQGLPGEPTLDALRALVDARWLVVHRELLSPQRRTAWTRAVADDRLLRVYADPQTWILEIPGWQNAGALRDALVDPTPRTATLAGLSRAPLELASRDGAIGVQVGRPFRYLGGRRLPMRVPVTLENRSDLAWPGLDVQTEGLVQLRYAFEADGAPTHRETVPLAADVPARSTLELRLPIRPPNREGDYALRVDLVQVHRDELRALPIPSVVIPVEVRPGSAAVDRAEPSRDL